MTYTPDITGFPYWKNKDKVEKKSLKKENKFYLKKIEKLKKKILEVESKKDENFKKAAEGWATIRGLKDIIKRKDDLINEAVSKREYDRLWDENASNEEEIKELKEERDFFHQEFHKTLQHQADDMEQYEKEIKKLQAHYDKTTSKEHCWANAEFAKKFEAYSIENEKLKEELHNKDKSAYFLSKEKQ